MKTIEGIKQATNRSIAFKGNNFITPNILGEYIVGQHQIELSVGKGIFSDRLYGVTVAIDDIKQDDLSTCFPDIDEAIDYMKAL
jgi:hypothetical protein